MDTPWADVEDEEDYELEPPEYDRNSLPPHACFYCGNHDPKSVVCCTYEDCNRWFCNSYGALKQGSHIVAHLVKARHKCIILHSGSVLGEIAIECFVCASRNVFNLGLVPSRNDNTLIFLCREPCLLRNVISEKDFDTKSWQCLILEKRFLPWIVSIPAPQEDQRARKITFKEICKIEEQIKNGEEPIEVKPAEAVRKIKLKYRNTREYREIFAKLIELEAEYDRELKKTQQKTDVSLQWEHSGNRLIANFPFFIEESNTRLVLGDELQLSHPSSGWQGVGTIIHINEYNEVKLLITQRGGSVPTVATGYTVELLWKPTTFNRMRRGLQRFANGDCDRYIMLKILGKDTRESPARPMTVHMELSAPNLPELNAYQIEAVKKSLTQNLLLIQGPPGTGKTVTSATILYQLVKRNPGRPVLVTAPSNIAVDQLTEKIHRCGLKVVRLAAKSREAISSSVDFLTLHQQLKELTVPKFQDLRHFLAKKEAGAMLSDKEQESYISLEKEAERLILSKAEIVTCTCAGSFDPRLHGLFFPQVLIDEATQATEPEGLLPILAGAQKVIMVGDHCQLGPVVMCKKASQSGFNRSMFERLVHLGNRPFRLHLQYRMHPAISEFPSNTFYEGTLQNGVSERERVFPPLEGLWPIPGKPVFFYNTTGPEELGAGGTSYLNRTEAYNVEKLVTYLLKASVQPSQIAIITPYEGQRTFIATYLLHYGSLRSQLYESIEISSVDSFQGREKEYIILSCVRSNESLGIGFLTDPRRLNVALTRAKYGMIICGNARVLGKEKVWKNLLNHYNEKGLLVEGALSNLKPCNVKLSPSEKVNMDLENPYVDNFAELGSFAEANVNDFLANL